MIGTFLGAWLQTVEICSERPRNLSVLQNPVAL